MRVDLRMHNAATMTPPSMACFGVCHHSACIVDVEDTTFFAGA